jgi:hypothetical protein
MLRRFALMLAACLAAAPRTSLAETIKQLVHQPPDGAIVTFQLTDGTVLAQGSADSDWYKLTPDIDGSYVNGMWKRMADLPAGYAPLYFASAVLPDGRLVISGGEYNFSTFAFTNQGAIYDPLADKWKMIGHPKGWGFIGDSPSIVLADGRFVVGEKLKKNLAALDPKTLEWTELPSTGKNGENAEEGWTLLPDGSFLTFNVKSFPKSERYLPDEGKWVSAGSTGVILRAPQDCCGDCIPYGDKGKCYKPPGEVGPGVLRPDGTVFAVGGPPEGENIAHSAIYTPPSKRHPKGAWTPGPDFPAGENPGDTFAALLPNGNVLVNALFGTGSLYEFDGTTLTKIPGSGSNSLMVLPTGEILMGGSAVFQSTGKYKDAWRPTVTDVPASVTRGSSYKISGTQFNGLSQANSFGDEDNTPTNYPLVRITNNATGHVFYARTHDHSTMGVATGSAIVSTHVDVPTGMEIGASSLEVVANGIPSKAVAVTVN